MPSAYTNSSDHKSELSLSRLQTSTTLTTPRSRMRGRTAVHHRGRGRLAPQHEGLTSAQADDGNTAAWLYQSTPRRFSKSQFEGPKRALVSRRIPPPPPVLTGATVEHLTLKVMMVPPRNITAREVKLRSMCIGNTGGTSDSDGWTAVNGQRFQRSGLHVGRSPCRHRHKPPLLTCNCGRKLTYMDSAVVWLRTVQHPFFHR